MRRRGIEYQGLNELTAAIQLAAPQQDIPSQMSRPQSDKSRSTGGYHPYEHTPLTYAVPLDAKIPRMPVMPSLHALKARLDSRTAQQSV